MTLAGWELDSHFMMCRVPLYGGDLRGKLLKTLPYSFFILNMISSLLTQEYEWILGYPSILFFVDGTFHFFVVTRLGVLFEIPYNTISFPSNKNLSSMIDSSIKFSKGV